MIIYLDKSLVINGPDKSSDSSSAPWMIIEQDNIPDEQQQVTEQEAQSMLSAVMSGYSAFSGLSSCPIKTMSSGFGKRTATYTATILIHKSNQIEDYDLVITKDGIPIKHSEPRREYRNKSESIDIDYNQTVQLNWQPFAGFAGAWNIPFGVWDTNSSRLPAIQWPAVDQYDGFLMLKGDLAFGIVKVSALAVMDLVTVPIEHQLGTQWESNVWAEVRWPAGADPEYQDSAECEILLPSCVDSAFNDCAGDQDSTEDQYWDSYYKGGPSGPTKVIWNKCTREVIEVTNDNRDTL